MYEINLYNDLESIFLNHHIDDHHIDDLKVILSTGNASELKTKIISDVLIPLMEDSNKRMIYWSISNLIGSIYSYNDYEVFLVVKQALNLLERKKMFV